MFLSRVELGPGASRSPELWREVTTPYGAHQALWRLFGRTADQARDFLYRQDVEGGTLRFLVLSVKPPGDAGAFWRVETKAFAPALRTGQRLGFLLRASPVVRRGRSRDGETRRIVQRHDLVMDAKRRLPPNERAKVDEAKLMHEVGLAWLSRQGQKAGFRIAEANVEAIGDDGLLAVGALRRPAVRVDGYQQHRLHRAGARHTGHDIRFSTLDFEGQLEVVDPEALLGRVRHGFGPQKAFGCGLMLLRRT